MTELTVQAVSDNLNQVQAFIDERLEKLGCKMKVQFQIDVAVEEIFVNIANYAYASATGMADISIADSDDSVIITFTDSGKAYNPLENPDPDTTLSAEDREIGGLGIFMVKKSMDDMSYERKDGKNILSITKKIK